MREELGWLVGWVSEFILHGNRVVSPHLQNLVWRLSSVVSCNVSPTILCNVIPSPELGLLLLLSVVAWLVAGFGWLEVSSGIGRFNDDDVPAHPRELSQLLCAIAEEYLRGEVAPPPAEEQIYGYNDGFQWGTKCRSGSLYLECRANCDLISPYLEHLAFLHNVCLSTFFFASLFSVR